MNTRFSGLVAVLLLLAGPPAHAQAPPTLSHQGYLEENGAPVDGTHTLRFGLYAAPAGGTAVWDEVRPGIPITDGVFSVTLGAVTPLPSEAFYRPLWLEVAVGTTVLTPRTALTAAPYALGLAVRARVTGAVANNEAVLRVDDTTASNNSTGLRAESASTNGTAVFGRAAAASGLTEGVFGQAFSTNGRGVLGSATATTGLAYGVRGESASSSGHGVSGNATAASGETYGVWGHSASTTGRGVYGVASATSGATRGVHGVSSSSTGHGVAGLADATSGLNYGVSGASSSTSGRGVHGVALASTGVTYGVYGQNFSSSGSGVYGIGHDGVYGKSSSSTGSGVYGESSSANGTGVEGVASATTGVAYGVYGTSSSVSGRGVRGIATATTGTNYGMYATSASSGGYGVYATNSAANGYAGYFTQQVRVNDALYLHDGSASTATIILDANYNGDGRVITEELEITGGSDLAEHFDVAALAGVALTPGMVVSIDPDHAGRLAVSATPYDGLVAGVVSGAGGVETGLIMGQRGSIADGDHPVALVGRVYVLVDAAYGAVRPGDLLTTSATPGHAMRASDRGRSQGAVLGKAMTGLESGRGLVLVLVSLQ